MLVQAKRTGLKHYDDMTAEVKDSLREQLIREQGYLCAYCMRRLDLRTMQVEHYVAQHPLDNDYDPAMTIDYHNMLGVCPGNKGNEAGSKGLTCDQSRGNTPLTINPQRQELVARIRYSDNGRIFSDDPVIDRDLQVVLNLNCVQAYLPASRKMALDELKKRIYRSFGDKTATKAALQRMYSGLKSGEDGRLVPFVGILLWYLEKKLRT